MTGEQSRIRDSYRRAIFDGGNGGAELESVTPQRVAVSDMNSRSTEALVHEKKIARVSEERGDRRK